MTDKQKALVQESFEKVRPIAEVAANLFYNRLFTLDPSLRALFRGDMNQQGRNLMQMIAVAVKGLDHVEALVPAVEQLGQRHAGYGVRNEHYETVGSALLWTLERGMGADFTPEVKEAWTVVYGLLTDVMQRGSRMDLRSGRFTIPALRRQRSGQLGAGVCEGVNIFEASVIPLLASPQGGVDAGLRKISRSIH